MPENINCRLAGLGFMCLTASTVAPEPILFGTVNLRQTFTLNLSPGEDASQHDIWFEAETSRNLFLTDLNGASFGSITRRASGYAGCREAGLGISRMSIRLFQPGNFFCIQTRDGRVGEVQVDRVSGDAGNRVIPMSYKVWADGR